MFSKQLLSVPVLRIQASFNFDKHNEIKSVYVQCDECPPKSFKALRIDSFI